MYSVKNPELSIIDLVLEFLRKWKLIAIFAVVGCLAGLAFSVYSNNKDRFRTPSEELAKKLETKDIERVETLFSRYYDYYLYRDEIENEAEALMAYLSNGYIRCDVKYFITSDMLKAGTILPSVSIDTDLYDKIELALFQGTESKLDVRDLVYVYRSDSDELLMDLQDEDRYRVILTAEVLAKTTEECDKVAAIIDEAFVQKIDNLKQFDSELSITFIDKTYNEGQVVKKNKSVQDDIAAEIVEVDKAMKLVTDEVNTLPQQCRSYFSQLVYENEEIFTRKERTSWKKMLVFGGVIGGALGLYIAFCAYLLNGTIKKTEEFGLYDVPVIGAVVKRDHFKMTRLVTGLFGKNKDDGKYQKDRITSEVLSRLKGSDDKALYLLCVSGSKDERDVAEEISNSLETENSTTKAVIGTPARNADDLRMLSDCVSYVIVSELGKAQRKDLCDSLNLCSGRGLKCLGAVTVEEG